MYMISGHSKAFRFDRLGFAHTITIDQVKVSHVNNDALLNNRKFGVNNARVFQRHSYGESTCKSRNNAGYRFPLVSVNNQVVRTVAADGREVQTVLGDL